MKNIQARITENVDAFIEKLQRVIGEFAVEAIEERLTKRRKRPCRPASPHRPSAKISALAESLYVEICRQPGETMMVLSKAIGQTAVALALPARRLVAAGRVKKTGQNAMTRYFPVGRQPSQRRGKQRRTDG